MIYLLPMQQVVANGMSPPHLAPDCCFYIVLKEEMPNAILVYESVGIIDPILAGGEMKLWSM